MPSVLALLLTLFFAPIDRVFACRSVLYVEEGSVVEHLGDWDGSSCSSRLDPTKPVEYIFFSIKSVGSLFVYPKDVGSGVALELLRIGTAEGDSIHYSDAPFEGQPEEGLFYSIFLEPGIYAIEAAPLSGIDGRFAMELLFVPHRQSDELIAAIVDQFESEGSRRLGRPVDTGDIPILFVGSLISSAGYCMPLNDGRRVIMLNDFQWTMAVLFSDDEFLIFHELGHCYLGRRHHNARMEDGRPVSIMVDDLDMLSWGGIYKAHREEYLDELFDPEKFGDLLEPMIDMGVR